VNAKSIIIAGGGTGGHVLAGVAVADSWKKAFGENAEILFVGARGGIEEKLVPRAGYKLEVLELGSLNRVSFSRKLKTLFQLPISFFKSARIILRQKPEAVLGVGGYASGPLVLMARVLGFFGLSRARTAILEQNSVPGLTNRILPAIPSEKRLSMLGAMPLLLPNLLPFLSLVEVREHSELILSSFTLSRF
jgi:UDP-N-acetylglucosamine--N-acetylmuramyl-(pentapeptide) pyrophosphoryl-undecaprenol N-acetylglucosamine transferase